MNKPKYTVRSLAGHSDENHAGSRPNFTYWRQFPTLKVHEIASLLLDIDPRALTDATDPYGDPMDFSDEVRVLVSSALIGDLDVFPVGTTEMDRHTEIGRKSLVTWLRKNDYAALADQLDSNIAVLNQVTIQEEVPQTKDWKKLAREIADEEFDRDTANQSRDNLYGYSRRVCDEMQTRKIHGPRGRITNAKTVQREALQGTNWWASKRK